VSILENFSLISLVLCIFLAIVIGLYVGNLLKNRRKEKESKQKRFVSVRRMMKRNTTMSITL